MKSNKLGRWFNTVNYPSYFVFFVTAFCNARCKMCFYQGNMEQNRGAEKELGLDEYEKISKSIKLINILGISGGEPFLRTDLCEIIRILYSRCQPLVVDLPTNGFFTDVIIEQVEAIARHCPKMVVDVQLSIDGPPEVHDEIRGLPDGFTRIKETYRRLIPLRKKYANLRIKACTVYSSFNQNHIEELLPIYESEFNELDRVVLSVAHGSVSDPATLDFDWDKYFKLCQSLQDRMTVKSMFDFHSIFTIALRILKNEYLKKVLRNKKFHKECGAGLKVIIVNETGKVFPCEPLWKPVGDLRSNGYDLGKILHSSTMQAFQDSIVKDACTCHWGLPISNNLLYKPRFYPRLLAESARIMARSIR